MTLVQTLAEGRQRRGRARLREAAACLEGGGSARTQIRVVPAPEGGQDVDTVSGLTGKRDVRPFTSEHRLEDVRYGCSTGQDRI